MASENQPGVDYPDLAQIAQSVAAEFLSLENIERLWGGSQPVGVKLIETLLGVAVGSIAAIGAELAKAIVNGEDIAEPAFRKLARVALKDITGVDAPDLGGVGGGDARRGVARNVGAGILNALTSGRIGGTAAPGSLEPSLRPAEDYVGFVVQMALEGWLTDLTGEMLTLGAVEQLGDLDDALANALGLQRSSRAVMRPLIDTLVATPAEWQINKTFRPRLLSPAEAVRQFARGRMDAAALLEELSRQGYSDERIEALVNAARRFAAPAELYLLWRYGQIDRAQFIEHLRDQGYEQADAEREFSVERLKRLDSYEGRLASVIVDAYADRRITGGDFDRLLASAVKDDEERARLREIGETRRTLNTRDLSEADARDAALRDIISTVDYRRVLERLGYTPDAVLVKELMLRDTIRDRAAAEEARRKREAEQAAEKAAAEAERRRRREEIERERAVTEPSVGQAVRFVVRGLWSTRQLADFLSAERYDGPTIAAIVDDALMDRDEWLDAQAKRARAEARAARTELSIAQLESAVLAGVLTVADYAGALTAGGFSSTDVDVLTRTLEERLRDHAAMQERRRQIDATATARGISVAQAEQAVLRGIGSLAQFDAWLQAQRFAEFDRTVLVRLLEAKLADQAAAEARRVQEEAAAAARAVPLAEIRRAVLLGVRPFDTYSAALLEARIGARDQALLIDLLRADLAALAAADAQRVEAERRRRDRRFTIAQLEALVRASLLTPDDYRRELARDGWSAQEIELLVSYLLQQIEEERTIPAPPGPPPIGAAAPRLPLDALERAVRSGVASVDDYAAAVAERGYTDADARVLLGLLRTRLEADGVAADRRARLLLEVPALGTLAAQLERAVRARVLDLDDYRRQLLEAGADETDAAVLAATLAASMRDVSWAATVRDALVAHDPALAVPLEDVRAAYVAGAIDRAAARGALIRLGLDLLAQTALLLLLDDARHAAAQAPAADAEG